MHISLNGLNYHITMQGQGQPILFLHGFTGSAENWQPIINYPSPSLPLQGEGERVGFQTIAPDLPGHGQTEFSADITRYHMEAVALDLALLIETQIKRPVKLVGYSMGGRLALYLARYYPQWINHLILESASPGLATQEERAARQTSDNALADRIEREGLEAFVNYWEKIPLFATQEKLPDSIRARLREQRLRNNPHGLANSLRGMGTGVQPSLWGELSAIQMPVLLMAGALDDKFTAIGRQMHEKLPNAELVIVPDAGHTIHLEQPEKFQELVVS